MKAGTAVSRKGTSDCCVTAIVFFLSPTYRITSRQALTFFSTPEYILATNPTRNVQIRRQAGCSAVSAPSMIYLVLQFCTRDVGTTGDGFPPLLYGSNCLRLQLRSTTRIVTDRKRALKARRCMIGRSPPVQRRYIIPWFRDEECTLLLQQACRTCSHRGVFCIQATQARKKLPATLVATNRQLFHVHTAGRTAVR